MESGDVKINAFGINDVSPSEYEEEEKLILYFDS